MKDAFAELGLSAPVVKALRQIQDEVQSAYKAKVDQLTKEVETLKAEEKKNRFDWHEKWQPECQMVYLDRFSMETDPKELGRLQEAFLREFHFYNLLIRGNAANDARDRVALLVVPASSSVAREDRPIPREDFAHMHSFVRGFFAGVRAFRRKRR